VPVLLVLPLGLLVLPLELVALVLLDWLAVLG
jgi:hypothetical protein